MGEFGSPPRDAPNDIGAFTASTIPGLLYDLPLLLLLILLLVLVILLGITES